jgi:nucleotide-binding universal stress UspA family protein
MYDKILITLDTSGSDTAIIEHVRALAKVMKSRIVLLHVADGWAARTFGPDAVSPEVDGDKKYLADVEKSLRDDGLVVESHLAYGDPVTEIVNWIEREGCDLIAMGTHGHRIVGDILRGTTASRVQHRVDVPVLMLRSRSP